MSNTTPAKGSNKTLVIILVAIVVVVCCVVMICFVVPIISSLAFIGMSPASNFMDTRNAQRTSDVKMIAYAIEEYRSSGDALKNLSSSSLVFLNLPFCQNSETEIGTAKGNIDLTPILVDDYLIAIPEDPSNGTAENTGYTICLDSTQMNASNQPNIEIGSKYAENGKTITSNK